MSTPNVQNITILDDLASGKWDYTRDGLLDATHLRFFTYQGIQDLLDGAGLTLITTTAVFRPNVAVQDLRENGNMVAWGKLQITDLSKQEVLQLFSYQYITIARREP